MDRAARLREDGEVGAFIGIDLAEHVAEIEQWRSTLPENSAGDSFTR